MIRLILDLSQVTALANVRRGQFDIIAQKIVERATWEVYKELHIQSREKLKSSRQQYQEGINKPEFGRLKGTITLTGKLPNMIEQGASPFDMKNGFRNSKKAKNRGKPNWYLTIPFRHATAGSVGESSAFMSVLPPEVQDIAKGLSAATTQPFKGKGRSGQGLNMEKLKAVGYGAFDVRGQIPEDAGGDLSSFERSPYEHKSPKYAGLQKNSKTYQLTTQGSYVTFRRVSENSAGNSWIHKGIKAYDLMPAAVNTINFSDIMAMVSNRELSSMGL